MALEIEIKFLILQGELQNFINLECYPKALLEQTYFSDKLIRSKLLPYFKDQQEYGILLETDEKLKNGRIRSKKSDSGEITYTLTVKAPRQEDYCRIELETEITESQFHVLKSSADAGTVSKTRYYVTRQLSSGEPIIAEIDIYDLSKVFALIEIEVPDLNILKRIKQELSIFPFLEQAKEMLTLPNDIQEIFKNSKIATEGFPKDLQQMLSRFF